MQSGLCACLHSDSCAVQKLQAAIFVNLSMNLSNIVSVDALFILFMLIIITTINLFD
jgi:hypothetical protein